MSYRDEDDERDERYSSSSSGSYRSHHDEDDIDRESRRHAYERERVIERERDYATPARPPNPHGERRGGPANKKPEMCRDHRTGGGCRRGSACPFIHHDDEKWESCRDFQRSGVCLRGELCPFIHHGQRSAMGGGGGGVGELCRDFMRGACTRGVKCPYVHNVGRGIGVPAMPVMPTTTPRTSSGPEVCRDYLYRKNCSRGSRCPYAHVSWADKDKERDADYTAHNDSDDSDRYPPSAKRRRADSEDSVAPVGATSRSSSDKDRLDHELDLQSQIRDLLESNRHLRIENEELRDKIAAYKRQKVSSREKSPVH
eukprot:TRINITY_DN877_c1_g1_i1.p1 TRINITY_DN877_c1_g1~~TRINITY_DN877_c1_g1_i1.p1  ORF type:complete len:313 (+),score=38.92 TRINITY_DN877_c1_g1_i1:85-1023(+)